jgi:hypothetical protein
MITTLFCGIIGMTMVLIFLGIMVWWVPALPLMIIVVGVMAMMIYDFYKTVRYGENGAGR